MNDIITNNTVIYESGNPDIICRDVRGGELSLEFASHLHYHAELVLITDGECPCTVDSTDYLLKKGDVLAVFPNRIHSYGAGKGEKYILIIVNPDVFPELQSIMSSGGPKSAVVGNIADSDKLYELFVSVCDNFKSDDKISEFKMRGYLAALIGEILSKSELIPGSSDESKALKSIVTFCTHNFNKDLSLEVLEKQLHLNKYYISHIFSNKLGTSFSDLINSLRISDACRLLRTTKMSVTEIYESVGFATQRTFNRAFLKYIGITPSEFRSMRKDIPGATLPH